jgi:hypothetical protein
MTASIPIRTDLAGRLMTVQNNYVLGLAALSMFSAPEALGTLKDSHATFGGFSVQFDQVRELLSNQSTRDESVKAFLVMLMCTLIKDSFELTRHHAKKAGLFSLLRSQSWYQFCRIIRNCIAHNYIIEFNSTDLSILPITWHDRSITAAMNNQELPLSFFGYAQAWQLFTEIRTFAETTKC